MQSNHSGVFLSVIDVSVAQTTGSHRLVVKCLVNN
jgi:hypothetical protein